jgi:transcription initiation factor IIE alpha subunit
MKLFDKLFKSASISEGTLFFQESPCCKEDVIYEESPFELKLKCSKCGKKLDPDDIAG